MAGTKKTTKKKITVSEELYREITRYCQMNGIEDADSFITKCLLQGYNVVKFGFTPKDNIRREYLGIKEPDKVEPNTEEAQESTPVKRKLRIIKKD